MHLSRATSSLLLTALATLSSNAEAKPLSFQMQNTTATAPVQILQEFPLGSWVENMAIRSNGQLLVTMLTVPDLYLIDPFTKDIALVASFPEVIGLAAITEVTPDVFAGGHSLSLFFIFLVFHISTQISFTSFPKIWLFIPPQNTG